MKKLILLLFIPLVSFGQTKFEYYESGAVQLKRNYVDGLKQGEQIQYYENGAVEFKVNFVDDLVQGEVVYYNKNGEIEKIENYIDNNLTMKEKN